MESLFSDFWHKRLKVFSLIVRLKKQFYLEINTFLFNTEYIWKKF